MLLLLDPDWNRDARTFPGRVWGRNDVVALGPRLQLSNTVHRHRESRPTDRGIPAPLVPASHTRAPALRIFPVWQAHQNAIFDVAWRCDDRKLVTTSGDQTARLWDVETEHFDVFAGHVGSVKAVATHQSDPRMARPERLAAWGQPDS